MLHTRPSTFNLSIRATEFKAQTLAMALNHTVDCMLITHTFMT